MNISSMLCLHPQSNFSLFHLIRLLLTYLFYCLLLSQVATGQTSSVNLTFPVFNSTAFSCTGIPSIVAYRYCYFNNSATTVGDWVDVLPPTNNLVYPNQAGRMMYKNPVTFQNGDVVADFNAFIVFSVEHTYDQPMLGAGIAFLIAPQIDTPDDSADGGFGLFPMDPDTGLPASGINPMVLAVEFDTSATAGIDVDDVPHVGIDLSSLVSANATVVGTDYYDKALGMWIEYNNTLQTLKVYLAPVPGRLDATAASLKPTFPRVSLSNFSSMKYVSPKAYIGISAGVFDGGFEKNKVAFWMFQTFGFPPPSLLAQWYQWWVAQSTTKKIGLIAGAVVGTILCAYACSECLFFCFFKRIKHPETAAQEKWPVRRRKSLPGTKSKPPKRKVRDSLSVSKPLDLWSSPIGLGGEPEFEPPPKPATDLRAMAESDDSSDDETTLRLASDRLAKVAIKYVENKNRVDHDLAQRKLEDGKKDKFAPPFGKKNMQPQGEQKSLSIDKKTMPERVSKLQSPHTQPHTNPLELATKIERRPTPQVMDNNPLPTRSLQVGKESSSISMKGASIAQSRPPTQERPPPLTSPLAPLQAARPTSPKPPTQVASLQGVRPSLPKSPTQKKPPFLTGPLPASLQAARPSSPKSPTQERPPPPVASLQAARPSSPKLPTQERPPPPVASLQAARPSSPKLPTQERPPPPVASVQAARPSSQKIPPQERPPPLVASLRAARPSSPKLPTQERPPPLDASLQAARPTLPKSPAQERPSPLISPLQAARPSSPSQQRPSQKTMTPQVTKSNAPTQPITSLTEKTSRVPELTKPSSLTQQRPSPIQKTMPPEARQQSSSAQQRPPPTEKPIQPEATKPSSSTQQRTSSSRRILEPQMTEPSSLNQQGLPPGERKTDLQVSSASPPPKEGSLRGAAQDTGTHKVIPQAMKKPQGPAELKMATPKSQQRGPSSSQAPSKEPLMVARPSSPQTSPIAASRQAPPKVVPPSVPQSRPAK